MYRYYPRSHSKKDRMESAHAGIYFYSIISGFSILCGIIVLFDKESSFLGVIAILIGIGISPMISYCLKEYRDLKCELEKKDTLDSNKFPYENNFIQEKSKNQDILSYSNNEYLTGSYINSTHTYWRNENNHNFRNNGNLSSQNKVLRCHCGGSYVFSMKNQPRWICVNNPHHYKIIKESDLQLPRMIALIPINERAKVYRYFSSNK